jgi:cytochrome P450
MIQTSSTLLNFTWHMLRHPEIQRKAHEELDQVVGRERLPDFDDKESLPYIRAIYKETLRWYPVAPVGVPHSVITDDEYKGMHIPRGSVLIPNVW